MTLDLPAILGSMKQEPTWHTARRNAMTLVKQSVFRVVLVALRGGVEIGDQDMEGPITLHALEGRLAVRFGADEVVLSPGQLLVLQAGLRHTIRAGEDSAFLLTLTAETLHPAEHLG